MLSTAAYATLPEHQCGIYAVFRQSAAHTADMTIGNYVFPISMGLLASLSLIGVALRIGREIHQDSVEIDIAVYVGIITAMVAAIADSSIQ